MVRPYVDCPWCGTSCVQLNADGSCPKCQRKLDEYKAPREFGTEMFSPPRPFLASIVVPGREEVWLRIYAALAGALGADGATSRAWADKALEEFDKRFPPK